ncbi:MAG: tRNA (N(6)-L-threonylcarbamoyladenosine(37)-C(2))-methylthiotransferase, partial [Candidatus Methanofastidiosa archaeon]|nr:tRNA (N(6)-L-threonylcarbamoyladenosine(37)-C(2))-methylthiotransferase [Candidatus Methanofastidiosa archaeon]
MIYIRTYGCTFNKSDSQTMRYLLGEDVTDSEELADTVIFNTCGVKGQTEHKVIRDIRSFIGRKRIIVAGCLPFINLDAIPEEVDAIIGPDQIPAIRDIASRVARGERIRLFRQEITNPRLLPQVRSGASAIIPISLGCKGSCTYCATRFARGELRGYLPRDIVHEVNGLVGRGYKEIMLTSQDTGCYGYDIGTDLPSLMSSISQVEGNFKLRVGMMNPNHAYELLDRLLEAYESEKVFKFLHLPVQSGSDRILKEMNRFYDTKIFLDIVGEFRSRFPELYLATDIIVGFPEETEEDFEDTLDLILECRPDKVNITRYSSRPGTYAAGMRQFPDRIKKDRSRVLSRLVHRISHEINLRYLGRRVDVLVTEEGKKGRMIGRMGNYKPVVCDGK